MRLLSIGFLCLSLAVGAVEARSTSQDQPAAKPADGKQGIVINDKEELAAYRAVEAAADLTAKVAAASAFMGKYPNSPARSSVETVVLKAIVDAPGDATRGEAIKSFKTMFPQSTRLTDLDRLVAEKFLAEGNFADAAKAATQLVTGAPDDVWAGMFFLRLANDALARGDSAHVPAGIQHGTRAVELLEADQRPASVDEVQWKAFKDANLPLAQQRLGVLKLISGDAAGATSNLDKATQLNPADPVNYFFLANVRLAEYDKIAEQYNAVRNSNPDEAKKLLATAEAKTDEVIQLLVKTVAFAGAKPEFAAVLKQARPELERLYKQRHAGSLDGLEAAITAATTGK